MRVEQVAYPVLRRIAKYPRLTRTLFRCSGYESPFDPEYSVDPYPGLERLRRTQSGPVYYHRLFRQWFVIGYDETVALMSSPSCSVADTGEILLSVRPYTKLSAQARRNFSRWLLIVDPPDHTRLRRLVSRAFTPRALAAYEPRLRVIADELLEAMVRENNTEVVTGFTAPLPIYVIAELLGLPRERWEWLRASSDDIIGLTDPLHDFDPVVVNRRFAELDEYFSDLIDQRRAEPRDDLISVLARAGDDGDTLDDDELVAMIGFLMLAGHETTTALLGNSIVALAAHPEQRTLLRARRDLVENAVEELIRFDTSVQSGARTAEADIELGGTTIPAGARIVILWGAANRDPRRWPDADELRLDRTDPRPISFGHGIHHCVGAALARMEMRVALPAFLDTFGDYRLDDTAARWNRSLALRGPLTLRLDPVEFGSKARPAPRR